jgi:uncharacterized protein (DUF433 family)
MCECVVNEQFEDAFDRVKMELSRSLTHQEEAFVVLMPGRLSGKATIGHRRISTEMVADWYWELGFDELVSGYDLTHGEIVVAVWYEARYGTRTRRKRWADWLEANEAKLWSPSFYGPPEAPPMEEVTT